MDSLWEFLGSEQAVAWMRAAVVLLIGLSLAHIAGLALYRGLARTMRPQSAATARRIVRYGLTVVVALVALHELGFNPGTLLGAAGIVTVALGFAAQTSTSNLVSGLFLVAERPFETGDIIRVGTLTGVVLSVDLLSVKLRTFDNLFVRVPNETLIKSEITNVSRFPIRRIDFKFDIAHGQSLAALQELLTKVADAHELTLYDPRPQMFFQGFGESGVKVQFSIWTAREHFVVVQNEMAELVMKALAEAGIALQFPHMSLQVESDARTQAQLKREGFEAS